MSQDNHDAEVVISDEELELDHTPDGTESPEELKAKLVLTEQAKKQILARAKKAESELKTLKGAQPPKPDATITEPSPMPTIDDDVVDLRLDGYSKDEVKFIMANGGRKALEDKDSFVSTAIQAKRDQKRAEQAAQETPDNSGMSEVERKYTPEQLSAMPLKDLEKILPHAES